MILNSWHLSVGLFIYKMGLTDIPKKEHIIGAGRITRTPKQIQSKYRANTEEE